MFAPMFDSIFWFFTIRLKTYNLWKSMAFFWKRNSYFRIGLVVKNCIVACHRYNDSFLKCCFSHKDFHTTCIAATLSDSLDDRSDPKKSINIYKGNEYFWHFGLNIQLWKREFLKSVGFSHYFWEVKLVIVGPFSDRIRLRSLFGRSGRSPDSLFCRTWGPILAHARFWSKFHIF